jgi:nitrogenase iron protein NifH
VKNFKCTTENRADRNNRRPEQLTARELSGFSILNGQQEVIMADQIAFYGKGGVGSSTLISNISAALVEAGFRVLQLGCSQNGDSCSVLNGGSLIPTVWDEYERHGSISFDSVVRRGFKDVYYIELGRPQVEPGTSAALQALDLILRRDLIASLHPDFVLYDLSGGQACGIMRGLSERIDLRRIYAVTTADFMSLAAVNSLIVHLERLADSSVSVPFGGLLSNGVASSFEESFISDFARHVHTHTLGRIPRSLLVRQCELYGKTVIEAAPLSSQSYFYRQLASQIVDESHTLTIKRQPKPFSQEHLQAWAREWADRLFAMENGLVVDGAAI